MKKEIAVSYNMKNGTLDDDHYLYDDGSVLRVYDKHIYPGGQNLTSNLTVKDLSEEVKKRLYESASEENQELVKKILNL